MLTHRQLCVAVCIGLFGLLVAGEAGSVKPPPRPTPRPAPGPTPRLYGAIPANPGDYSYFVNVGGCSGALIAREWVMTAGHCAGPGSVGNVYQVGWTRGDTSVGVRETRVVAYEKPPQGWDIALMKVEPVDGIRPVQLAAFTPKVPALVRGVGHGEGSPGGLGSAPFYLTTEGTLWWATGVTEGTRYCYGDSGSPQVIETAGGPRLVGELYAGTGCHAGALGVSVNVTDPAVRDWITAVSGVTPGPIATLTASPKSPLEEDAASAGDLNWQTYWTEKVAKQQLVIYLPQPEVPVNTLTYLPRQDSRAGDVTSYSIYYSYNGSNFYFLTQGTWPSSPDLKVATWPSKPNIRQLEIFAETTNGARAAYAEIATSWTPPEYPIRRGGTAVAATSYEFAGEYSPPGNATDSSPNTIWHSQYSPIYWGLPQEITIQTNDPTVVLRYLPRQDGSINGIITTYTVSGSYDGVTWDTFLGGTWGLSSILKGTNQFSQGRQNYPFYKLRADAAGGGYASAADIELVRPARRRSVGSTAVSPEASNP